MRTGDRRPAMAAAEYRVVRDAVLRHAGISLSEDAREATSRKLEERLSALGVADFSAYVGLLKSEERGVAEIDRVVELVATHETYFLRELSQLEAFTNEIVPRLREQVGPRRALTIWSAGCSTGEEAYSIAMLLDASEAAQDTAVRIIGTDISQRVVRIARQAVYQNASFRALPEGYERYFETTRAGRLVTPKVRSMCQFAQLNLLDDTRAVLVGRVDAIFCRNVVIYFNADARRKLFSLFYERLHPGGYLMLGHSESLLSEPTKFEPVSLEGGLVYRRPTSRPSPRGEVEQ
jgi:chemotaxis protein methyltransferase CheR